MIEILIDRWKRWRQKREEVELLDAIAAHSGITLTDAMRADMLARYRARMIFA